MKIINFFWIFVWLLTAGCSYDRVGFLNTGESGEVGILVDGKVEGPFFTKDKFVVFGGYGTETSLNDIPFHGPGGNDINLNMNFTAGPGEIIGFTNLRLPRVMQTIRSPYSDLSFGPWVKKGFSWTEDEDHIWLKFGNEHVIDVTVWIVAGDIAIQEQEILQERIKAEQIWVTERQGIRFGEFKVVPKTDVVVNLGTTTIHSSDFYDFPRCESPSPDPNHPNMELALMDHIGFDENRVNVYLVGNVEGQSAWGLWCDLDTDFPLNDGHSKRVHLIFMGISFGLGDDLLVHELGHAFDISHTDSFTDFLIERDGFYLINPDRIVFQEGNTRNDADRNVMQQYVSVPGGRQFLTEGQTFRSVINKKSAIQDVYGIGQKLNPKRQCGSWLRYTSDRSHEEIRGCPLLQKRIWTDMYSGPNFSLNFIEQYFAPP